MNPKATLVLLAAPLLFAAGCGPVDITAQRVEDSIAIVFANYWVQEQALTGHPGRAPGDVHAGASCSKNTTTTTTVGTPTTSPTPVAASAAPSKPPAGGDKGGGEWTCLIDWTEPGGTHHTNADPDHPATRYDVKVGADACYGATNSLEPTGERAGPPSQPLGPTQLIRPDGTHLTNPLLEFDGCFDVFDTKTHTTHAPVPTPTPPPQPTPPPPGGGLPACQPATAPPSATTTAPATGPAAGFTTSPCPAPGTTALNDEAPPPDATGPATVSPTPSDGAGSTPSNPPGRL